MLPAEVSQRHRALVTEVVGQWRRWSKRVSEEPSVPYDDDDDVPTDRVRVISEVLGRFVGSIGKLDINGCETASDVDRRVAVQVKQQVAGDNRPGAREAARLVLRRLTVPTQKPISDFPPPDDDTV